MTALLIQGRMQGSRGRSYKKPMAKFVGRSSGAGDSDLAAAENSLQEHPNMTLHRETDWARRLGDLLSLGVCGKSRSFPLSD